MVVVSTAGEISPVTLERVLAASFPSEVAEPEALRAFVGRSAAMTELRRKIALAAPAPCTVLIEGERGTGKELVARALHALGRPGAPFHALNCGGLSPTLGDAQLFGYARGAFTGATTTTPGAFERAGKGTLFLDELAELSLDGQRKLLRVLEDPTFERLGEARFRPVEARVVAATNRNLHDLARRGDFLPDLLDRFDVIVLHLPPLRDRLDDLPLLVDALAAGFTVPFPTTIDDDAWAMLRAESWPGNVRQLRNLVHRIAVMHGSGRLDVDALARHLHSAERAFSVAVPWEQRLAQDPLDRALDALLAMEGLPGDNLKRLRDALIRRALATCRSDRDVSRMTGLDREKVAEVRRSLRNER
jgi:DNA-binding NtrC family response regulator